jgi:putative nucleotidyltransferase with HDIG domain
VHEERQPGLSVETSGRPNAELVLTHLDSLPTLSVIAVRVLQVTGDPSSDTKSLVSVLRGDQSLTTRILSIAGSSWAGVCAPVSTLEKAVPLLGFAAVRSIVLSVSVFDCFPVTDADPVTGAFDRARFWKHSLAVACVAQRLCAARPEMNIEPQDAFVAGLLHDIGKVALSAVFPKAYDRAASRVNESRGDIADAERAVLGADHTVAGRQLAERWRLPRMLQEVVWLHHLAAETLPSSVISREMISIVQLADTLAREQRVGYSGNHTFYENSPRLAARLGFSDKQVAEAVTELISDVEHHAELLGLHREGTETLYVQAMAQANRELGKLNTELALNGQRLAAGARYFRAITVFDKQLNAWSDPPAVVTAMVRAGATAFQRSHVAAFGLRDDRGTIDVCQARAEMTPGLCQSQSVNATLADWLREPGGILGTTVTRAPAVILAELDPLGPRPDAGTPWLVPIVHDGQVIGGLIYWSEADERSRLLEEQDDLRCFLASLGLALGRANAQAAARRLSDDLAEANRRLQQMQGELLRSRTLSMIAEMAAGAGHELNSPLTVISGRAQMLAATHEDPEARRALEMIQLKAHECSHIVSELMDFARPRSPTLDDVDLAEVLADARDTWLARHDYPAERLRLEPWSAGPDDADTWIRGDREQLLAVFTELLDNAGEAVTGGGSIVMTCRPAVAPDFVEAIVRDTGCGMSPAVLQRAFDPFFSHRRAGRSRGLGLPRAFRIVEGHNGRIWLESIADQETTAHVLLPRRPSTPPQQS